MKTEKEQKSIQISHENLLGLVRSIMGGRSGRESDEHPLPKGPWDPVIREVLERSSFFDSYQKQWRVRDYNSGPFPEPWKIIFEKYPILYDLIDPIPGAKVSLNPQPLPPRFAFVVSLAQTLIYRAELLQDLAGAMQHEGEKQGIIVVGGYISRFVDDICGNDFKFKWPFPWPPPYWFIEGVNASDLIVMAAEFDKAGTQAYNKEVQQSLLNASAKLIEAGVSKM